MKIKIIAKTDIGHNREQNEDAFAICPNLHSPRWEQTESCEDFGEYGSLLAVADGMGGANAGEVASSISIKTIQEQFTPSNIATVVHDKKHIIEFLSKTVSLADKAINDVMTQRPETYGMGTTIVICWLLHDQAYVAWCGDSRCYVYNDASGLKTLTKDHSWVQELVDRGEISKEEAFHHPDNNIITRGLGDFITNAVPDIVTQPIKPNDIILLCSDGLCGYCDHQTIEKIIKDNQTNLSSCCDKLINTALKTGAEDNITVALASLSEMGGKGFLSFFKSLPTILNHNRHEKHTTKKIKTL